MAGASCRDSGPAPLRLHVAGEVTNHDLPVHLVPGEVEPEAEPRIGRLCVFLR